MATLSDSDENRLREILLVIDSSDVPLEDFFEKVENEFGNKMFFSQFKARFEQFYSFIPKGKQFYYNKILLKLIPKILLFFSYPFNLFYLIYFS